MSSIKVCAIVVTYNRLELLKKCIQGLSNQSRKLDKILVINNSSTDETLEWCESQNAFTVITLPNNGATASFSYGMKYGLLNNYDWLWIMDDDSIADVNSLKNLIKVLDVKENIGYLTPSVLWKDGSAHVMNTQHMFKTNVDFYKNFQNNLIESDYASFVGLFVSSKVVEEVGLPFSEYFIWYDDVEFTERINRKYKSYLVLDSKVIHFTPENHSPSLKELSSLNIVKFKFGVRNKVHLIRSRNGFGLKGIFVALIWLSYSLLIVFFNKPRYFPTILINGIKGFMFQPKIKFVNE